MKEPNEMPRRILDVHLNSVPSRCIEDAGDRYYVYIPLTPEEVQLFNGIYSLYGPQSFRITIHKRLTD